MEIFSFDRKTFPLVFAREQIIESQSQSWNPEVTQLWKHLEAISGQMT